MRVLIIYYSQSGNTLRIAKAVARGVSTLADGVELVTVKQALDVDLKNYDLIGLGSPIWKADPPNVRLFIERLPEQNGNHIFLFTTHGTLPHLYFPIVIPNLKRKGFNVIGYNDWYADVYMPGMPKPYYTHGHPDEIDFKEAEEFGREMALNSKRIANGETRLIYPEPELNEKVFKQAMICSNMLLSPVNPQGDFIRDESKCLYPKCTICEDNCTMGYIDLANGRYGNRGFKCDDCHECSYCFMLCPSGAINTDPPMEEHIKPHLGKRKLAFEEMLDMDEAAGKFRRLIPVDEVGFNTPYVIAHPNRPYMKVPKDTD
jgi:flavodoxin/NAD-dependent dihydropyrimidine dehydrogenase PreA subunit